MLHFVNKLLYILIYIYIYMSSPIRDRTVLLSMLDFVNKLMYILIYIRLSRL